MSYSRWITSDWYTFWNSSNSELPKDQQLLTLWHVTKQEDVIYKDAKLLDTNNLKEIFPEATIEDIDEVLAYINEFIADVDKEFSEDDHK